MVRYFNAYKNETKSGINRKHSANSPFVPAQIAGSFLAKIFYQKELFPLQIPLGEITFHLVQQRTVPKEGLSKMAQVTYGDNFGLNLSDIPERNLVVLVQQAVNHRMGNQVDSNVVGKIRAAVAGKDGKATDVEQAAIAAYREANKDQVQAWVDELRAEVFKNILSGDLSVRQGGPRKDPVEKEYDDLLLANIAARLMKGNVVAGKTIPAVVAKLRKMTAEETVQFKGGQTRTLAQLRTATEATHGEAIRKEADRIVKERNRMAERAAKQAEAAEGDSAEALGF